MARCCGRTSPCGRRVRRRTSGWRNHRLRWTRWAGFGWTRRCARWTGARCGARGTALHWSMRRGCHDRACMLSGRLRRSRTTCASRSRVRVALVNFIRSLVPSRCWIRRMAARWRIGARSRQRGGGRGGSSTSSTAVTSADITGSTNNANCLRLVIPAKAGMTNQFEPARASMDAPRTQATPAAHAAPCRVVESPRAPRGAEAGRRSYRRRM